MPSCSEALHSLKLPCSTCFTTSFSESRLTLRGSRPLPTRVWLNCTNRFLTFSVGTSVYRN
jgi:hypothetical protein